MRSQERADVVVIGAGPAGLAAAIAARQKGFEVVVADGSAPPIEKPCGEGMMPETLASLRDLGVDLGATEGHRFAGICFVQEGARVAADFPQGPGIGLPRSILHERMAARAEGCGVQFRWKTPVSNWPRGKLHRRDVGESRARNFRDGASGTAGAPRAVSERAISGPRTRCGNFNALTPSCAER